MSRPFVLAPATVLPMALPEIVSTAAKVGYDAVGLPLNAAGREGQPDFAPLEPSLLAEVKARLAGEGIRLFDGVAVALRPGTRVDAFQPLLETAADLGASAIMITAWDADEARLADNFAALCARAHPLGLTMAVEFLSWCPLRTLEQAAGLVKRAGQSNGGVMLDPLHFFRSGGSVEQLKPHVASIAYAQICDAPLAGPSEPQALMDEARQRRLNAGDGELPLRALFDLLPTDMPVSIEGPLNSPISGLVRAETGLAAARRVLD